MDGQDRYLSIDPMDGMFKIFSKSDKTQLSNCFIIG